MCEWGTSVQMEVTVPAHLSHTGEARRKVVDVDACIAPVVKALNHGGIYTVASCCGHGKGPGSIILGDGRELFVLPSFTAARHLNAILEHSTLSREPSPAPNQEPSLLERVIVQDAEKGGER